MYALLLFALNKRPIVSFSDLLKTSHSQTVFSINTLLTKKDKLKSEKMKVYAARVYVRVELQTEHTARYVRVNNSLGNFSW